MFDDSSMSIDSNKSTMSFDYDDEMSEESDDEKEDNQLTIMHNLIGSQDEFTAMVQKDEYFREDGDFNLQNIDKNMKEIQFKVFRSPTFIEDKIMKSKEEREERELLKLKMEQLAKDERAKEAESRASAFQFDFGYLDAEVYELLKQLESVYPDIRQMPDTTTSKSIYTTTKSNLDKMGLKIVLNRICLIGKYKQIPFTLNPSDGDKEMDIIEDIPRNLQDKLRVIRSKADSIFAKELGEITGCLLNYQDYFLLMMEGPELSIMDVMNESTDLILGSIMDGCVLFVAPQVLVRFLQDWTDLNMHPPASTKIPNYDENVNAAKEKLVQLSDKCKTLWREVAIAKHKGLYASDYVRREFLPDEKILKYAINCGLLRPLDVWLKRITRLTFGDFTSDTWPQMWYPIPFNAHIPDVQLDSLGILDTFENIPGMDDELEEFLNSKTVWKSNDENITNEEQFLRERMIKPGSILTLISTISKSTAYTR